MLEDKTIEALIIAIDKQIDIVDALMKQDVEEKFKYLMIGKINGMMEALRLIR